MAVTKSSLVPLEVLTQIQLGITPPLSIQRGFLLEHYSAQLRQRGITEAKLIAMDGKLCAQLLKRVVLEQYLSVPFRVFSFDMEFTGPPAFTADGPTEDITEMGLYSPMREETFSCLVLPACGRKQAPGVTELTKITDEMLEKHGLPFVEAWEQFLEFVNTPDPGEGADADQRILLLSHGGKLADVSLIKWTLERFNLELPPSFVFGDTIHLIRDAHRRRPVTVDKHPPSWKLLDLVQWLKIPPTLPAHRAGNDAKMTWDALYHTLLRYGDDELTPREQLVSRFFDEDAKAQMRMRQGARGTGDELLNGEDTTYLAVDAGPRVTVPGSADGNLRDCGGPLSDSLDLDLDDIFDDSASPSEAAPTGSPTTIDQTAPPSFGFSAYELEEEGEDSRNTDDNSRGVRDGVPERTGGLPNNVNPPADGLGSEEVVVAPAVSKATPKRRGKTRAPKVKSGSAEKGKRKPLGLDVGEVFLC